MFELFKRLEDNHHPDHNELLHIANIKPGQQIISKKLLGLRRRYPDRHRHRLEIRQLGHQEAVHLAQLRINETNGAKLPDYPQASYEAPRGGAQSYRHEFLHGVHALHLRPNKENEALEQDFLRLLVYLTIDKKEVGHLT